MTNLSNTWVNSRKNKLVAISIDFILCVSFYQIVYFNKFNSYPNKLVTLVLSIFWLILSYILGRYDQIKKINFHTFFYSLIKVIINFLVCNIIYLLINSYKKIGDNNYYIDLAWWVATISFLINQIFDVTYYDLRISMFFWILIAGLDCIITENKQLNKLKIKNS